MTWTVLHDAVEHQRTTEVIRRARSNSEEAALVDDHGYTPLHIAVQSHPSPPPPAVLKALIDAHPGALTDRDRHGDTPLHVALKSCGGGKGGDVGTEEVVRVMLEACPAAAAVANREGLMPLHVACRHCPKNDVIIAMLVEVYPAALRKRIKMGEPAPSPHRRTGTAARAMSLTRPKPTDHFDINASARNTTESVSDLRFRDLGVQVRDGSYPLHMALEAGPSLSVVKILLTEGSPDVLLLRNKHGSTPLHVLLAAADAADDAAAAQQKQLLIDVLLEANITAATMVDSRGRNLPLHVAAEHGSTVGVIQSLLEAYPEAVSRRNDDNMTPLQVATVFGKCGEDVLRVLRDASE